MARRHTEAGNRAGARAIEKHKAYRPLAMACEALGIDVPLAVAQMAEQTSNAVARHTAQVAILTEAELPANQRKARKALEVAYFEAQQASASAPNLAKAIAAAPDLTPEAQVNADLDVMRNDAGALGRVEQTYRKALANLITADVETFDTLGAVWLSLMAQTPAPDMPFSEAAQLEGLKVAAAQRVRPYVELIAGSAALGTDPEHRREIVTEALAMLDEGQWAELEPLLRRVEARLQKHKTQRRLAEAEATLADLEEDTRNTQYGLSQAQRKAWEAQTLPGIKAEAQALTETIAELEALLAAA